MKRRLNELAFVKPGGESFREKLIKAMNRVKIDRDPHQVIPVKAGVKSPVTGRATPVIVKVGYIEIGSESLMTDNTDDRVVSIVMIVTNHSNTTIWADSIIRQIERGQAASDRGMMHLLNHTEIDRVSKVLTEAKDWWLKMTPQEREEYLKKHPRSRLRQQFMFNMPKQQKEVPQDEPEAPPSPPRKGIIGWAKLVAGIP
jgi:hypothetical protein